MPAERSTERYEVFRAHGVLAPFYTDNQGDFVGISSDTYPYPPGVPGRTRGQLAEAKAQNLQPSHQAGNGYILGPDDAIIEYTNSQTERVDHVHMWEENPVCAQLWYQTHLEATPRRRGGDDAAPAPTDATCKQPRGVEPSWPSLSKEGTYRSPTAGVSGDLRGERGDCAPSTELRAGSQLAPPSVDPMPQHPAGARLRVAER